MRFGEYLLGNLASYGVRHVFGIPGVHTAELYRGLSASGIRHITPRHEQAAGFMADGYARLSGRPGVCFVITGPGLTNIATAMGQACGDSIPMLVISAVNATRELGHGRGNLHELPDQSGLAAKLTAFSHTLLRAEDLPAVLARAFAIFGSARPRPVHIEIPVDVMERGVEAVADALPAPSFGRPAPDREALSTAARMLQGAERPLLLAGGGARGCGDRLRALAEGLDAPVVMTVNGRGLMPFGHPLGVSASPSLQAVRRAIEEADVVLAVGTELGPTDYDMYGRGGFQIPGQLIRIEIDAMQMVRNRAPDLPLLADAELTLAALAEALGANRTRGGEESEQNSASSPGTGEVESARSAEPGEAPPATLRARSGDRGSQTAESVRSAAWAELSPAMRRQVGVLNTVRDALPGCAIVGDSTQAVYAGNLFFEAGAPGGWFNSATGYGTLGYALPAAIGAKLAAPERPVVCLAGDGGLQFTLGELGSAIDAGAPIILLVWNNRGYGEIKTYMESRGIAPAGVDLHTPDFVAIARAYGWQATRLEAASQLADRLREAAARTAPTLIELDQALMMG